MTTSHMNTQGYRFIKLNCKLFHHCVNEIHNYLHKYAVLHDADIDRGTYFLVDHLLPWP